MLLCTSVWRFLFDFPLLSPFKFKLGFVVTWFSIFVLSLLNRTLDHFSITYNNAPTHTHTHILTGQIDMTKKSEHTELISACNTKRRWKKNKYISVNIGLGDCLRTRTTKFGILCSFGGYLRVCMRAFVCFACTNSSRSWLASNNNKKDLFCFILAFSGLHFTCMCYGLLFQLHFNTLVLLYTLSVLNSFGLPTFFTLRPLFTLPPSVSPPAAPSSPTLSLYTYNHF